MSEMPTSPLKYSEFCCSLFSDQDLLGKPRAGGVGRVRACKAAACRQRRWAPVVGNATEAVARSKDPEIHRYKESGTHRLLASRAARDAFSSSAAEEQEEQPLVIVLGCLS